jgi:hypothetical protein
MHRKGPKREMLWVERVGDVVPRRSWCGMFCRKETGSALLFGLKHDEQARQNFLGRGRRLPLPKIPVSTGDRKETQNTASVPKKTVSLEGFTPPPCALFCAHPRSKTIVNGRSRAGKRIASTGAANQDDSNQ